MMTVWFACWFAFVLAQRLLELRLAARNAKRIRAQGGYEMGAAHYPLLVGLHAAFFLSTLAEFTLRVPAFRGWFAVPTAAFVALQAARWWCIRSLGTYWNTRVFVVPGMRLVRKGPYRFVRHPNYWVVTLEMAALPLMFGCWTTAVLFPLLNAAVLRERIAVENEALREASNATWTPSPEGADAR